MYPLSATVIIAGQSFMNSQFNSSLLINAGNKLFIQNLSAVRALIVETVAVGSNSVRCDRLWDKVLYQFSTYSSCSLFEDRRIHLHMLFDHQIRTSHSCFDARLVFQSNQPL